MEIFRAQEKGWCSYFIRTKKLAVVVLDNMTNCRFSIGTKDHPYFCEDGKIEMTSIIFDSELKAEILECIDRIVIEANTVICGSNLVTWYLDLIKDFLVELEKLNLELKKIEESEL